MKNLFPILAVLTMASTCENNSADAPIRDFVIDAPVVNLSGADNAARVQATEYNTPLLATGTISDERLKVIFLAEFDHPSFLKPIEEVFYLYGWGWDKNRYEDYSVSDPDAMGFELSSRVFRVYDSDGKRLDHFGLSEVVIGDEDSIENSYDYDLDCIDYVYVDRDVTIKALDASLVAVSGPFMHNYFDLKLTRGWNKVWRRWMRPVDDNRFGGHRYISPLPDEVETQWVLRRYD